MSFGKEANLFNGSNLEILTNEIETEIEKVLDWLLANKLIINLNKTHSMLFTNKRVERKINIKAKNTTLEQKKLNANFLE